MFKEMKKVLFVILTIIIIIVATIFVTNYVQKSSNGTENSYTSNTVTGTNSKSISGISAQIAEDTAISNGGSYDTQDGTKIIKKSNITMQTDNYEVSLKSINGLISSSDSIIVKMQENQGDIYNITNEQSSKLRNAEIVIKVPKDKFENFNIELKRYANVVSYYEEAQDISSTYADIEAKIESYKLQEQQLNELLKRATVAKDLLEISNQTQNVIQQRESLQRQKKSYDNQIEYSTVTLKLLEVKSVEITEKGTFSRIKDTFASSLSQIQKIFINMIMFIVYIIPYVMILAIVILFIYVIRKLRKK